MRQAMILAAGFGTRLRPFTEYLAKPLFPILNTPLLVATTRRLINSGFTKIIINCHHLPEQIIEAVQDFPQVVIQHEREILGTGGGLRLALSHLSDAPLLIVNGDIYHLIDLKQVYEAHLHSEATVTMVMHDYPRFNGVEVFGNQVRAFQPQHRASDTSLLAFTGIHVVDPAILEQISPARPICIVEHYRSLLAREHPIAAKIVEDVYWADMGTVNDYLGLHGALLSGQAPLWEELSVAHMNEGICLDPGAECHPSCIFDDWVCVGKVRIGAGVELTRSVIWDEARIKPHTSYTDRLLTPYIP